MILFKEDWKNYPEAIIDYKTSNISFLKLANLYREMGVENHAFILALMNKDLQGVDPHSEYLTLQQKLAVGMECKLNPWYFFREVARVPATSGNGAVQLEANRGNICLYWCFFNHIMIILIQIRQTGKSLSVDEMMVLLMNILCMNTDINLLTKDDALRATNIRRLKDIDSELPAYLRQRSKMDTNNLEEISIKSMGNHYRAHVPQKSPKAALNVGRGLTSPIFQMDEAPFQSNIAISMPAALAAGTAARETARLSGEPYGTIITTTAGKRDDRDGRYVYDLLQEAAEWSELFLDCKNLEDLERTIIANSRGRKLRINATFNHKQLGKDDAWLKRAIDDAVQKGEDADRDFFNMWTSGNQSSPLVVELLERIRRSQQMDFITKMLPGHLYITKWYCREDEVDSKMRNGFFVLGMDTSDASGSDDISLVMTNIYDGSTIAAGNYNETNLITFAEWLCQWFVKYENFVAIIERKSSAIAIIDYLLLMLPTYGIDPFKRIYNTAVNSGNENPERWKEVMTPFGRRKADVYTRNKTCFGFITSGSGLTSRTELYSTTLQNAAKRAGNGVKDKTTIDQITGLMIINGRVDHPKGAHDDMVIAWLLCHWLLTMATNLSFYGIDSKRIYSDLDKPVINTQEEYDYHMEQTSIRNQIVEIEEEMSNTADEFVMLKLEQKLRSLNRNLILEEGEVFSVDELINNVKEAKRAKKLNRNQNYGQGNYGYAGQGGNPYGGYTSGYGNRY